MNTPQGQVPAIQRYKIGYHSDEWGVRSLSPIGIYDDAGPWVRYEDHAAALCRLHSYCQELESQVIRDCMTHVQKPAGIEHVVGDVLKNGVKLNMTQQPAPATQQAPVRDYPPLPDFDRSDAPIWEAIFDWQTTTPGPDAYRKANAIESAIIDQLRAYVDADRAARSPADSVLEDAADPLQGAANWLAEAHGQFSPIMLAGCLMIGYTRAKRLHDAALAARKQGGSHDPR